MRRLVVAALIALSAAAGAAQMVPEPPAPEAEIAGTWFCLSVRQTQTGLCLDDPLP